MKGSLFGSNTSARVCVQVSKDVRIYRLAPRYMLITNDIENDDDLFR